MAKNILDSCNSSKYYTLDTFLLTFTLADKIVFVATTTTVNKQFTFVGKRIVEVSLETSFAVSMNLWHVTF